nr:MAG: hypothetical protein DIU78_24845 [Pseudomonadota bacterium]
MGIAAGAGLTVLFTFIAGLIGALFQVPTVTLFLGAIAFLAAGAVTARIRPNANALEPALGAALAVLVFAILQVITLRERLLAEMSAGQVGLSMLFSVLLAFALAWLGARIVLRARGGRSPHAPSPLGS